jgi:hypothetical protein
MRGGTPDLRAGNLSKESRQVVARYLHRILRAALKITWPRVHLARSFALEENGHYRSFVIEGSDTTPRQRQYVAVVGPEKGKPVVIPLTGISRVSGNIRLVLDETRKRAFVHVAYEMHPLPRTARGPEKAIDWGITEVCTDDSGAKHGTDYGRVLSKATEQRNKTGKARGKLWALTKKTSGSKRARHIARCNLGTKKQTRRRKRTQASLRTISGAGVKEVIYGEGNRTRARGKVYRVPEQRPQRLIVEDLAHLRGKAKSKKISRVCSSWARSENQGRMTVHAYLGCSEVKTVNAAYTSQTCPDPGCGYVSRDNRNGDEFHCRNPHWECNLQGDADHVAAMNLKSRVDDLEIHRYTSYIEVKKILEARFLRRKENRIEGGDAFPGQDGQRDATSVPGVSVTFVDRNVTAHGRTPSKPQRREPDVGDGNTIDSLSPSPMGRTGETRRLESEHKRSA